MYTLYDSKKKFERQSFERTVGYVVDAPPRVGTLWYFSSPTRTTSFLCVEKCFPHATAPSHQCRSPPNPSLLHPAPRPAHPGHRSPPSPSTWPHPRCSTPSYPMSVLSHYPPDTKVNYQDKPGYRICGAEFAKSSVEYDIIRLAAGIQHDSAIPDRPW